MTSSDSIPITETPKPKAKRSKVSDWLLNTRLKSPDYCTIKGIKRMNTDIPTLRPGEKKRREFMNQKIEEIAKKNPTKRKSDIRKMAEQAWLVKKADSCEIEFGAITAKIVAEAKKKGKLSLKKETISNTLKTIQKYKCKLADEENADADKKFYSSRLKKAMDCLRNTTALKKSEIDNILSAKNDNEVIEL